MLFCCLTQILRDSISTNILWEGPILICLRVGRLVTQWYPTSIPQLSQVLLMPRNTAVISQVCRLGSSVAVQEHSVWILVLSNATSDISPVTDARCHVWCNSLCLITYSERLIPSTESTWAGRSVGRKSPTLNLIFVSHFIVILFFFFMRFPLYRKSNSRFPRLSYFLSWSYCAPRWGLNW